MFQPNNKEDSRSPRFLYLVHMFTSSLKHIYMGYFFWIRSRDDINRPLIVVTTVYFDMSIFCNFTSNLLLSTFSIFDEFSDDSSFYRNPGKKFRKCIY